MVELPLSGLLYVLVVYQDSVHVVANLVTMTKLAALYFI